MTLNAPRTPGTTERLHSAFGDWTPRAVVFDCDGLLLDTETVWNDTQNTVLARHGATLTAEQDAAIIGSTLEQSSAVLAEATGVPYEDMLEEVRADFLIALAEDLEVLPGAAEVLAAAAARVPLACASNSWHSALVDKLTRTDLIHRFENLQSSDTVAEGKPAPDMYLAAVEALGVDPADALAVEDSPAGAHAARDAGLRLIVVPTEGQEPPPADLSLGTLDDPELLAWIATWGSRRAT